MNTAKLYNVYKNFIWVHKEWIVYFLIGCFLTCPFLIKVHFNGDAYSLLASGYEGYATVFMRSSRVITALTYHLFALLRLPYDVLAICSVFLANIFMASACNQFHKIICQIVKIKKTDIVIFVLSVILVFYNFFIMEYFGFIEAYALCLGVLLTILSIKYFLYETKKDYIISLILLILSSFCYQSVLSLFICLLAFLVFLKLDHLENRRKICEFIKKGFLAFAYYGGCYILSFVIMKAYSAVSGLISGKDGVIDIASNIYNLKNIVISSLQELFRFIDPIYFYPVVISLFLLNVIKAVYNKKYQSIIWLAMIVFLFFAVPFIPNLFLPEQANYVAPRMLPSLPAVVGILSIFYISAFQKESTYIRDCVVTLTLFFSVVNMANYNWTLRNANGKYYQDMRHVEAIYDQIENYEKNTGEHVTTIYYAKDDYVPYFYSEVSVRNSFTYRMYAYDWITGAAINAFWEGRSFEFLPMDETDKERLFKENVNYVDLNDDEFVFEGQDLYLLLY